MVCKAAIESDKTSLITFTSRGSSGDKCIPLQNDTRMKLTPIRKRLLVKQHKLCGTASAWTEERGD